MKMLKGFLMAVAIAGSMTVEAMAQNVAETDSASVATLIKAEMARAKARVDSAYDALNDSTLTDEQRKALNERVKEAYAEQNATSLRLVHRYITNPAGIDLFLQTYRKYSHEQNDSILHMLPEKYRNERRFVNLASLTEAGLNTSPGRPFIDLELQDPAGHAHRLAEYIKPGVYTLVDFWASWCAPCRKEMPVLVEASKLYGEDQLRIVGISLDDNVEAWQKGINDLGITWPQLSDFKGWKSEASRSYAVNGIPATVLIDGDGIIIARGLRGEALMDKLAELLAK